MNRADTRKPTARDTAIKLLTDGYWPTVIYPAGVVAGRKTEPRSGKEPMGDGWGQVRITIGLIHNRFRRYTHAGAGVCLGPGRGPDDAFFATLTADPTATPAPRTPAQLAAHERAEKELASHGI